MLTTVIEQTEILMKQEAKRERIEAYKKKNIILNVEKAWEKFVKLRVEEDEDAAFGFIL